MEQKGLSWGWIIFLLIIFWPVGLFLVIRKLAADKSALMSGKTSSLSLVGWILIALGVLGLIGVFVEPVNGTTVAVVVVLLAMLAGGVLLLIKVSTMKKTAVKYKKYINIVINQNERSIDTIASAVGLPYGAVIQDLQAMIDIGYLSDAYIHQGNRALVLKQHEQVVYVQQITTAGGQIPAQTRAIRCSGCGANIIVTAGKVSECEFCGTPMSV